MPTVSYVEIAQVTHMIPKVYIKNIHFNILDWSPWETCGTNCKRKRTRTCAGGSECEQSETDEEECQDGNCDSSEYMIFIPNNISDFTILS